MGRVRGLSIDQILHSGDRILLDASALLAYFSGIESTSHVATRLFDTYVSSGRNPAIVSAVTVMEILVRPLRRGAREPYEHVVDFLSRFPNLRVAPVDLAVAQEAASLRAAYNFSSPDALNIATGIIGQVGHLVTNDGQWKRKLQPIANRVAVCTLSDYV